MNLKTCLFSYSILWVGVLSSIPGYAEAVLASVPSHSVSSPTVPNAKTLGPSKSKVTNPGRQQPHSIRPIRNIAPAESLPAQFAAFRLDNLAPQPNFAAAHFEVSQSWLDESNLAEPGDLTTTSPDIDPELGRLRLRERTGLVEPGDLTTASPDIDPELGRLRLRERTDLVEPGDLTAASPDIDPELGRLRLRERQVATRQEPQSVFLFGRIDYFNSDNILLNDFDPVNDQLLTASVSLLAAPNLGPRTQLIASVGGDFARYRQLSDLDYNDVQFRAGIRQTLFPRTYGEISWSNQQFFELDGARFLNDHSLRLSLSRRDRLAPRLTLDSFYQFRVSFTDPAERSRLSNTIGTYLNYEIQPDLDVGLDYQLILTDFTQQERTDSYHQLLAQLSYNLSRNSRVSLYGGFSFGRSSDPNINFNSGILGIAVSANFALF